MVRILLAIAAGAVVFFVWNMLSWMVLGVHDDAMLKLPDEDQVAALVNEQQLEPGYYIMPMPAEETEEMTDAEKEAAMEEVMERHRQGPIVSFIVSEGGEMMPPSMMASGLVINLIGASVLAVVMTSASCCQQFWQRAGLGTLLGLFVGVTSYGALYVWMLFPADYIGPMIFDCVIGWTLAGAAMAAIIPPSSPPANAAAPTTA